MNQLNFTSPHPHGKFPQTRYQGSKLKLAGWLEEAFMSLDFTTALDAFGGTASASYILKKLNKKVDYNDILKFNSIIGKALIENNNILIEEDDLTKILTKDKNYNYKNIVERNFSEIYYLDNENEWLDLVIQNIALEKNKYKQAGLYWALFQSCISKRPYNLFHRKNLNVRTSDVKRSFGNKTTWDKAFDIHFKSFVNQFNGAVFDNNQQNLSLNKDVFDLSSDYDLVYIDTPYIPAKGSLTNYHEFYHFLEGISNYNDWEDVIDYDSKHRKLETPYNIWCDKKNIQSGFYDLFSKFRKSLLVISYRSDGVPSIEVLVKMLEDLGKKVKIETQAYKYALSTNKTSSEVLIIAE